MMVHESERRQNARGVQLRLSVAAEPRAGLKVRREVLAFAAQNGIEDGDDLCDFVTAIGEAIANAIEHAQTTEPIEVVTWMLGEDRLFASVQDKGIGFHPVERPIDSNLPDALAERGRGLPIMQRCSDIFSVSSAPGEGTRITLGRYVQRTCTELERQATG
jgi:stage II sporulation protein AB (anti-sigma F factor)